jgi:ribonuclease BN (tRNA processing enzyme)
MDSVEVIFLGSGDALGSGGRFQTCILLRGGAEPVLLDCGASSLVGMKRAGIDPGEIGVILLTHLHGDHFGGLPFLILDGQFSRRQRRLLVAGPSGVQARVEAAMEVLFPNSSKTLQRFSIKYVELIDGTSSEISGIRVTPFAVEHFSGAPSHSLRVDYGGRVVAYSGDTEWTEALLRAAAGADLFICEAYFFEKKVKYHLDYATLRQNLDRLSCKRIIVTHMHDELLRHAADLDIEAAYDGLVVRVP